MSEAQSSAATAALPEAKSQPTRKLPTDRIAFQKMLDIMRAYGVSSQGGTRPVHYSEAASYVKMSANTVSLMNTFLIDSGLVEKSGNDFIPNRALIDFAQAYSWSPETAAKKLAPAFRKTWFGTRLLGRLAFRAMTFDEAVEDLAGQVGAQPELRPQIETLVQFLVQSGLVRQEGTSLFLGQEASGEGAPARLQTEKPSEPEAMEERQGEPPRQGSRSVATGFSSAAGRVQLHVNIDVGLEEMGGWAPERISAFFAGLAQVLAAKKGTEQI